MRASAREGRGTSGIAPPLRRSAAPRCCFVPPGTTRAGCWASRPRPSGSSGCRRFSTRRRSSARTRGVPDVVEDGRTGRLAPGGDEAGLAGLVRELLLDAGTRGSLGRAAAAFVAGERNLDAAVARLQPLLARIAAPAGVR